MKAHANEIVPRRGHSIKLQKKCFKMPQMPKYEYEVNWMA